MVTVYVRESPRIKASKLSQLVGISTKCIPTESLPNAFPQIILAGTQCISHIQA